MDMFGNSSRQQWQVVSLLSHQTPLLLFHMQAAVQALKHCSVLSSRTYSRTFSGSLHGRSKGSQRPMEVSAPPAAATGAAAAFNSGHSMSPGGGSSRARRASAGPRIELQPRGGGGGSCSTSGRYAGAVNSGDGIERGGQGGRVFQSVASDPGGQMRKKTFSFEQPGTTDFAAGVNSPVATERDSSSRGTLGHPREQQLQQQQQQLWGQHTEQQQEQWQQGGWSRGDGQGDGAPGDTALAGVASAGYGCRQPMDRLPTLAGFLESRDSSHTGALPVEAISNQQQPEQDGRVALCDSPFINGPPTITSPPAQRNRDMPHLPGWAEGDETALQAQEATAAGWSGNMGRQNSAAAATKGTNEGEGKHATVGGETTGALRVVRSGPAKAAGATRGGVESSSIQESKLAAATDVMCGQGELQHQEQQQQLGEKQAVKQQSARIEQHDAGVERRGSTGTEKRRRGSWAGYLQEMLASRDSQREKLVAR